MRILYGPVDSWRFGRSLGVDPLAGRAKICPFSCTYCQYGPTPTPTVGRRSRVSVERLQRELEALGQVSADCVTFAGLGEPTAAANLRELVLAVRSSLALPLIILTGSGLIPRADVRRDLLLFDQVVAALDSPDEALFRQIRRPASGYPYSSAAIVEGLRQFRQAYSGRLVLQMMYLQVNVHAAPQMAALARTLEPDEVQLNTPLQPALGGPITETQMRSVERAFAGMAPVRCVYVDGQAQTRPRFP